MSRHAVIDERLDVVAGRLNAAHAELVDIAVEVLADPNSWGQWETGSPEKFLAWRTGVHASVARKIVAVARRVDDLPRCLAAFRDGLLSLDQIAPVAKRVPWWADEEICRQAQMMTVEQVSRTASKYPWTHGVPKPDGSIDGLSRPDESTVDQDDEAGVDSVDLGKVTDPEQAPEAGGAQPSDPERLAFWWDDDGRFRINGEFDAAGGSIIENALTEARDAHFQHGHTDTGWADALLLLSQRSLATVAEPARRNRFRTLVHVDHTNGGDGAASSATGHGIAPDTSAYLTCDSDRSTVHCVDGLPVSVSRSQRTVPARTRQIVIHRDGGCRVPGCIDTRWLDVHHIIHWAEGGATDMDNLLALCSHHHRQHHRGLLGITGAAAWGSTEFTNRHGQPITPSGARPRPPDRSPPGPPVDELVPLYKPALRQVLERRWQHFNLPVEWRPYWDDHDKRAVKPLADHASTDT